MMVKKASSLLHQSLPLLSFDNGALLFSRPPLAGHIIDEAIQRQRTWRASAP